MASVQSREFIHGQLLSRSIGSQTSEDRTAVFEDKSQLCEVLDEYKRGGNSSHQPRLTDGGSIPGNRGILKEGKLTRIRVVLIYRLVGKRIGKKERNAKTRFFWKG